MSLPRISIVTPSFNQGRYIEQTIRSVLDQNYPNLEYIIIDGGSTDNTCDIIKKYERQVTYWVSGPDKGQTDAINKGFAQCSGDVFNWINSDDYYEPGALHKIGELFSANPGVDVLCGKEWSFYDNDPGGKALNPGSVIKENIFETIREGIIDQPCTFFRKKSIDAFFPLDTSLTYVMDRQLWWSYLLKNGQDRVLQTDEILTNFRLHPKSKSIGEGDQFENEFDRLKLTLFRQLNAPVILEKQIPDKSPLDVKWEIGIGPTDHILAAFASWYAQRSYVKNDLNTVASLMKHVIKWKGMKLTKSEWKLSAVNWLPMSAVKFLKKIKG